VTARAACVVSALLAVASAGCKHRCWYEWRDEPYIRKVYARGERRALERMRSPCEDDREIGARALAVIAREARQAGDEERARRLARELMDLYDREDNEETRSIILALCLREAGEGDAAVAGFLKSRLHSAEHAAAAAYSLASLRPPGAFEAISEAYSRAEDFGRRYELLGALWLLGDRRALPLFERALDEIDDSWPERIHHMRKADYKRALAGRLRTLRVACRNGGVEAIP
jgi:hypothetical protein